MAQFTKVNGDFLPVLNLDTFAYTNSGANAVSSANTVQPQGPKLQYFTITATGALSGAQVNIITQTVQSLATIYIYEYTDTTNDTFAFASYPAGAWTTATLDTAVNAALTAASLSNTTASTASATFTN
jgi:hypothetical protein